MINVGVIGLGMMGNTHLDVYGRRDDVAVVAIADRDPQRLSGKAQAGGNIEGQARGGADLSAAKRYADAAELIADADVQLVDVCLPTPLHLAVGKAALEAGKHVMVEKPLARTYEQALKLARAAESAAGLAMPGMCMRFWPGWDWLKKAVDEQTYGKVLAATFRRVTSHPGGPFYEDAQACGGALLDLHIHDTDFIQYLLGQPQAVESTGYSHVTDGIDHVLTRYRYPDVPLVTAEGSWAMSKGFGFSMRFCVNFERATAVFDIAAEHPLMLHQPGGDSQAVSLEPGLGYEHELAYFLDCIAQGRPPTVVTLAQAAEAVRIVEAEAQSIETGRPVELSAVGV